MTVLETKTYAGLIGVDEMEGDRLRLTSTLNPDHEWQTLAELFEDELSKKVVTVRYWITDERVTRDQAQEAFLKTLFGVVDAEWSASYSEITGFLWADQDIKIDGHDLLDELQSFHGKWLILEVDIHSGDVNVQSVGPVS